MADAQDVGAKVLEALADGRARRLQNQRDEFAPVYEQVRRALDADILTGKPPRGRAERISKAIHGAAAPRQVRKILARLFGRAGILGSHRDQSTPEEGR